MLEGEVVEDDPVLEGDVVEEEPLDVLPVIAEVRSIEPVQPAPFPVLQAAAAAATGFVAGAATIALLRRHGARRLARDTRELRDATELARRAQGDRFRPGTTRTYLVNVRVISSPGE